LFHPFDKPALPLLPAPTTISDYSAPALFFPSPFFSSFLLKYLFVPRVQNTDVFAPIFYIFKSSSEERCSSRTCYPISDPGPSQREQCSLVLLNSAACNSALERTPFRLLTPSVPGAPLFGLSRRSRSPNPSSLPYSTIGLLHRIYPPLMNQVLLEETRRI